MIQPKLYIAADHDLDISDYLSCKSLFENLAIGMELEQYLFYASHLTNEPPPLQELLLFQQMDDLGTLWFEVNGIIIKLAKNIIQVRFPIIFRSFPDYDYLRIAIYAFLLKLLSVCHSTEITAYPSHWEHYSHEIKNQWHKQRLGTAQRRICEDCTSYKRTKQHLERCLSKEAADLKQLASMRYRGWYVKKIGEI